MSIAAMPADPYLALPLHGVQLIEASAGTGKTYTLATLVTRLVIERGLRVGQILAVTYTEAATQELRQRIRQRLQRAARQVEAAPHADDTPEDRLNRALIARHLETGSETREQLAVRLRRAVLEIDLAAIFTIHGFCARVLREHALQSGQPFSATELLTNDADLREQLAADLWRTFGNAPEDAVLLTRLWKSPGALARDLRVLLSPLPLLPAAPAELPPDPSAVLEHAADALCQRIAQDIDAARRAIDAAFDKKVLDGRKARRPSFDKAFAALLSGRQARQWSREDGDHLDKLLPHRLLELCRDDRRADAPASPLFDALAAWFAADELRTAWLDACAIGLLHRLRAQARRRLLDHKRTHRLQTYDDMIDGVADALQGPQGQALAANLRSQYAIALVDEFQDTDARQWQIFRSVFGEGDAPALFLIGDPKQAIYGFRGGDVHTYLAARQVAAAAPALDSNFRSRPALLRAIETLYARASEQGGVPFVDPGIRFQPVQAGGTRLDADYLRSGQPAPTLTVCTVGSGDGESLSAGDSRQRAADACAASIHAVLSDARAGQATIAGKAVAPGDIAVLVRTHKEATLIQRSLSAAGIPAVAAGKQSLFVSDEAGELRVLLEALLQPGNEARLRTALSTVLLGLDAQAIAALEHDNDARLHHQNQAVAWRERWQRSGPFALISDLCAAHAERLLQLVDGERRLTNYLQLGELLQAADARSLGMPGLVDWLRHRIADADADDDTQLLRLESDARRVQIVTLHKSKGLEYPLVFLPFAGIGEKPAFADRHCVIHQDGQRVLHWKIDKGSEQWKDACAVYRREDEAEDARLLYVGLTRAEHALWLATGPFYNARQSRLAPMLQEPQTLPADAGIVIEPAAPLPPLPPLPPVQAVQVAAARHPQRVLSRDWWVYSFTQLAHAEGAADSSVAASIGEQGASDEPAASGADIAVRDAFAADLGDEQPVDRRFSGSRFGNVLHDALEHTDFDAWRDWRPGDAAPAGQDAIIVNALREGGYAEADLAPGAEVLVPLIGHTLGTALPEGGRLADLPVAARRAEIEFNFAMASTSVQALLALLHRHGVLRGRNAFGARQRLEGLMTGLIDLTYCKGDRWYVLDYKSNQLPGYDAAAMQQAMAHSEYDLQALIYTLALHRWLRFRLGGAYDYGRNFGGVRYLFCRGLDLTRDASPGIHAQRFAPELVHALDALFAGDSPPSHSEPPHLPLAAEGRGEGKRAGDSA